VARGIRTALVLALLALMAPSAASAQLPVGEKDGVRMVRERGELVVIFTQRGERDRKRVAGKRIDVYCTGLLEDGTHEGNNPLRAPRRGRRIHTGDGSRGWDYCRLWLEARTVRRDGRRRRVARKLIVSVPLTQEGAVFLDEQEQAIRIFSLVTYSQFAGRNGYLTPEQLLARQTRPGGLVALASPADTPPPGVVGYYSDGAEHVAAVALSTLGKRLFLEVNADAVHTNILRHVGTLE
jgi:hypothetical protein